MKPMEDSATRRRDWTRRYPPLGAAVAGILIAIFVLPSTLNVPQSNPTQTAEYAPVPPEKTKTPPAKGNTSSLGLGNGDTIAESAPTPGTLPPSIAALGLRGKTPTTKLCVRDRYGTLRQTDDPLSPPCVADFRGNNFGATWQGVNRDEVRILVYLQGFSEYIDLCSRPEQRTPDNTYFDMNDPPQRNEICDITALRAWQTYFNYRYQTYGRFVHFFAYYSGQGQTPEDRRADAADNYQKIRPFAVLSYAQTNENDYLDAMAQYKVLNFGSFSGRDTAFFNQYPKFIWGYHPSVEEQASNYASFLCTKVAGRPASFAGPTLNGKPRKFGLIYTTDSAHPEMREFKDLVVNQVKKCGMSFAAEGTFPHTGFSQDVTTAGDTYPETNMSTFKQAGVTTIIWAGGVETQQSQAAAEMGYLPEWILAGGDGGFADGWHTEQSQNQQEWDHSWVVTDEPYLPALREQLCYAAYKSVDANETDTNTENACKFYDNLRQLFTGIQVAGPRLNPSSVDQGFHAIPAVQSVDPRVPACFYDPGDYTCIKDGVAMWWDSRTTPPAQARASSSQPGCYHVADGGKRYISGQWPPSDVLTMKRASDPCTAYGDTAVLQP